MSCQIWQKSRENAEKTPNVDSRSFTVIEFVTNQKGIGLCVSVFTGY